MGLRLPQSAWTSMSPQQQFLYSQGITPMGMDQLPQDGEMISPSMATPEQQKALQDLQAAQMQSFEDQRQSVKDLEAYTNQVQAQPVQTNLSSLMGLADAWTGSNLAQSYQAPESGESKRESVARLKQAIGKAKGEMTADELALLKAKLNAMTTQSIFGQKQAAAGENKSIEEIRDERDNAIRLTNSKLGEAIMGGIEMKAAIKDYTDLLDKVGVDSTGNLFNEKYGELQSAHVRIINAGRKINGTGVLNLGEIPFLEKEMSPAVGFAALKEKYLGRGESSYKGQARSALKKIDHVYDTNKRTIANSYGRGTEKVVEDWGKQLKEIDIPYLKKDSASNRGFKVGTIRSDGKGGSVRKIREGSDRDPSNWETVQLGGKK